MRVFHKQLGNKIRVTREAKGISQEELAERSNLSVNQIGRIERAERSPNLTTLLKVCNGLSISVQELLKELPVRHKDEKRQESLSRIVALLGEEDERKLEFFLKIASDIVDFDG